MSDNNTKNLDKSKANETPKKRSFFGGEINEKTKELLDFRYNTQEEIDKLNEDMVTTDSLDDIINNQNKSDTDNVDEDGIQIQDVDHSKEALKGEVIEPEIKTDIDETDNNQSLADEEDIESNNNKEDSNEEYIDEKNIDNGDIENENIENENIENENIDEEDQGIENQNKFFDPFELNIDEEDDDINEEEHQEKSTDIENTDMFDPFGLDENSDNNESNQLNEEDNNENINQEVMILDEDQNVVSDEDEEQDVVSDEDEEQDIISDEDEKQDIVSDEDEEQDIVSDEDEEQDVNSDEDGEQDVNSDEDEEQGANSDEDEEQGANSDEDEEQGVVSNEDEGSIKHKHNTKGLINDETDTEQLQSEEQSDLDNNDEYIPSAEELFEREPDFFGDDELSQQFMHLVQNTRGILKIQDQKAEQELSFKILGGKTAESTLEYIFYLIEEEDEPIDLYIKKVETNDKNGEEEEHLLQFSYNNEKELNIFIDEVILYERINKMDSSSSEYIDTKSILEKFIFLTETYYDELKAEIDKQHEERQKKKQLQQIFKGF